MTKHELLNYAVSKGIIELSALETQVEDMERKRYLEMHRFKVWKDSKGYWITHLPDEKRTLIKKWTREELEDVIIKFYRDEEYAPTLRQVFNEWLDKKLDYGEIQRQTYDRYKTDFDRFYIPIAEKKIKSIDEEFLEDYCKKTIHDKELTAKAWSGMRLILLGVFKYAKKKGYTNLSISEFNNELELSKKIFKKRKITAEEAVFNSSEQKVILAAIEREKPTLLNLGVILAFQTGLRAGELASLKYSDLEGNVLHVTRTEIRYKDPEDGKTYIYEVRESTKGSDGYRNVIVKDETVALIKRIRMMNPFTDYLFTKNGKRMKGKAFSDKLVRLCKENNIYPKTIHRCRKTYCSKLISAGLDEKLITHQMGHVDISTSEKYYNYNIYDSKETVELITSALG